MTVYNGSTKIGDLYYGSTKIKEAYYGSTKVYSSVSVTDYTITTSDTTEMTLSPAISSGKRYKVDLVSESSSLYDLLFYNSSKTVDVDIYSNYSILLTASDTLSIIELNARSLFTSSVTITIRVTIY